MNEFEINGKGKIRVEVITPAKAVQYLSHNFKGNRKLNKNVVHQIASDMKNGKFIFNPAAPIVFSNKGTLIDGQHRLWACVESGKEFSTLVVTGCDESTYKVIDIGKSRTVADQINSEKWSSELSTLAKWTGSTRIGDSGIGTIMLGRLNNFQSKKERSYLVISKTEVISEADEHRDELLDAIRTAYPMRRVIGKGSYALYAYFVWLVKWLGRDAEINEFIENFCDLGSTSKPIIFARTKLLQKAGMKGTLFRPSWVIGTLLYAYDAYTSGKNIKSLAKVEDSTEVWNGFIQKKRKQIRGEYNYE